MKTQKRKQKKIEESLSYTVEVRDKEGRVLQRISAPSRSYVEQWNQHIRIFASHLASPIRNTFGVEEDWSPGTASLRAKGPIGEARWGIRVGKGFTPVAIDDYVLEAPLEEGTGVDQFEHQAVTFTEPSVVGSTCSFTIKRIMINNSGATISGIREIGVQTSVTTRHWLVIRDVLPSGVYVPHGGSITVTYTIPVTV